MKTVAILGASGFVGVRLVEMLHLGGRASVRPIVHRPSSIAPLARFKLDIRAAKYTDRTDLTKALEGCDTLIHLATAEANVIRELATPVYAAAAQAGVRRMVFASSASVHGQAPAAGTTERSPLPHRHVFLYNAAKAEAEKRLLRVRAKGPVELVILRPGIVWGPRSRWVTDTVQSAKAGTFGWLNGGQGIINPIYVDNFVQAIDCACTAKVDGEIFLLNDPKPSSWREFYTPWIEACGLDAGKVPDAPPFVPARGLQAKFECLRVHPMTQRLAPSIPGVVKRTMKAVVASLPEPKTSNSLQGLETQTLTQPARLTQEMTELQRCAWRFPVEPARTRLGWAPIVDWETAVERTLGWLRFAEAADTEKLIAMADDSYTAYVPVYNQAATLGTCLAALKAQTFRPAEIIVVDDGSTDESVKIAEAAGVAVLRQPQNLGRGAARARAIQAAKSDLVLACDAGNRLPPDFALGALKHFKDDPNLAAVHGWFRQSNSGNVVQRWRSRHLFARPTPSLQREATHVTAGCIVRQSAVLAVGNYDVKLRAGEDAELGRRLQSAGWEVWLDPDLGIECLTVDTVASAFERYGRWNETEAPAANAYLWRDYAKRLVYAMKVLAVRDIQAKDWAAAGLSLLLPHYLARRAWKRRRDSLSRTRPVIYYVNTYLEPWLDRCWRREAVSRAHLWGADALQTAGFDVRPVRSEGPHPILRMARWLTRITGGRTGSLAADLIVLWRAHNGDIVYIAGGQLLLTPLAVRCGLKRVRIVAWIYKPPQPFSWRSLRGLSSARVARKGYTGWLALTPHVEAWLRREHPTARVRRVVWSSDTDYYPPASGAGSYFAATGVTQRDYAVLLTAAHRVNFPFVILGPDELRTQAPSHVTWHARTSPQPHSTIDDNQLRQLYHGARAILIPLRPDPDDASGFTNLLEAMACGRPVVMTRTGALDLTPAVLGIGFDIAPGDAEGWATALQTLAREPAAAERFAARSAQLVRDYFNLSRFEKDLVAYFKDLAENRPEPPQENIPAKLDQDAPCLVLK